MPDVVQTQSPHIRSADVAEVRHPSLSVSDRAQISLYLNNDREIDSYLQRRGFEVVYDDKGDRAIRSRGESGWKRLDPKWTSLSDLPADVADASRLAFDTIAIAGIPSLIKLFGVGGVSATAGVSLPVAMGAGGAAAASADGMRQLVGMATGVRTDVDWESIAFAGIAGTLFPGAVSAGKAGLAALAKTDAGKVLVPLLEDYCLRAAASMQTFAAELVNGMNAAAKRAGQTVSEFVRTDEGVQFLMKGARGIQDRLESFQSGLITTLQNEQPLAAHVGAAPTRSAVQSIGAPLMSEATREGGGIARPSGLVRSVASYIEDAFNRLGRQQTRNKGSELLERNAAQALKGEAIIPNSVLDRIGFDVVMLPETAKKVGFPPTMSVAEIRSTVLSNGQNDIRTLESLYGQYESIAKGGDSRFAQALVPLRATIERYGIALTKLGRASWSTDDLTNILGIDPRYIADGNLYGVQVKTSVAAADRFIREGTGLGRNIPVIVGDASRGNFDDILRALRSGGQWIEGRH
ncbi:MAG: hypothetical protein IT290_06325 [Deltaproteobacteria bacterium]|nr:hypothetical protein [Deltaproteobacteria bacterium]